MIVKTRIAPSPTGSAHVGTARGAIWNYLYAKKHGGVFALRIEDTDRDRYFPAAIEEFKKDLTWIGVEWDELVPSQYALRKRHLEVANQLLEKGAAYKCFSTKEEIDAAREKAESKSFKFQSPWRDADPSTYPMDKPFAIRLKTPQEGVIKIQDIIRGDVEIPAKDLEDLVIIRSDGESPIYNLTVVVDDHDMEITHVARGEEHLINTFKQKLIYDAMGWDVPQFAHLPLILAPAGQSGKLSKRHGAVTIDYYKEKGFLPEALFNYLLRLGWGHGNDEIISKEQAIEWFDFKDVSKAGMRFDLDKALSLNAHYIREKDDQALTDLAAPFFEKKIERMLTESEKKTLLAMMPELKTRVKTLVEMADLGAFLFVTLPLDEKAQKILEKPIPITDSEDKISPQESINLLIQHFSDFFVKPTNSDRPYLKWESDALTSSFMHIAEEMNVKIGKLLQPVRAKICFSTITPPLSESMEALGMEECIKRLKA
ncbi:MAG: glutamate--tRNA ligase [Alphaproteobacteria bacterium]|nr:glutamate--tRNA ligase [Alphaproteobacteria bacterium]